MRGESAGFKSFDVTRGFQGQVVSAFTNSQITHTAPTDGRIIRMHYQWTLWMLMGAFAAVYYNWFFRDIIECSSHFNAETQIRLDYLSLCTTYPFVVKADGSTVTLLYYRYVHYALLLMGGLYYLPRKISKTMESLKLKRLFEHIFNNCSLYDGTEKQLIDVAGKYMTVNMNAHGSIFRKYLLLNCLVLGIDVFCFYFIDWIFFGKFASLGYAAYPYHRDGEFQSDYISQTFQPFVHCKIDPSQEITIDRTDRFGCHLIAMQVYEKIFFVLWFWLIALMFFTSVYIIFLLTFFSSKMRQMFVRFSKPICATETVRKTIEGLAKCCGIDDFFILYKLRQHFSARDFFELLRRLGNETERQRWKDALLGEHSLYESADFNEEAIEEMIYKDKPNTGIFVDSD